MRFDTGEKRRPTLLDSKILLAMFALLVNAVLIAVVNFASILGYLYFFLLTLVFYGWLIGKVNLEPVALYALYSFLMIVLYLLQRWAYPAYMGFSGATDDARYYVHVADSLPAGFPVTMATSGRIRNYELLMRFLSWYPVTHPFDILFFNALPLVLIPHFTRQVAVALTGQQTVGETAYRLTMLCPFLLSSGLVLVRDGWTAMACIGAIWFLLSAKYVRMGFLAALSFYLRAGSGLLLIPILMSFVLLNFIQEKRFSRKLYYVVGLLMVGGIALLILYSLFSAQLYTYLSGKDILKGGRLTLFRGDFVDGFLSSQAEKYSNLDSIMLTIYQQGPLIRLPLGFAYFFMSPLFTPNQVVKLGDFRVRSILMNIMFPILFIVYLKYLIKAFWIAWRTKDSPLRMTALTYLGAVLVISQLSIQFRHKVMVIPLLYIIVAYGYHKRNKTGELLGIMGMVSSGITQIVRAILRLV